MNSVKVWFVVLGIVCMGIFAMRVGSGVESMLQTRAAEKAAWGNIARSKAAAKNEIWEKERKAVSPLVVLLVKSTLWVIGFTVNGIILVVAVAVSLNAIKFVNALRAYQEQRLELKAKTLYPDHRLQLPVVVHQTDNVMIVYDASTGKTKRLAADTVDSESDPMMITASTSVKNTHISNQNSKKSLILNG